MSKWTRPLKEHTKLDYWECYAKIVLEDIYPKDFKGIEIKDKPDLQMKNGEYGVEVTNSRDREQINAEKLYAKVVYNIARDKEGAIKEIRKCGCNPTEYGMQGKPGKDSFELILRAFNKKLKKLNSGNYKIFNKNCLFVFSDILANDRMIKDALAEMQHRQLNSRLKFYKVFVLVPGECYILNLFNSKYSISVIEDITQSHQSRKAREIVEEYEKL